MSKIILSCGHEVDDFEHAFDVMYKSMSRDGEKAITYAVVCGPCEDRYRQSGHLFDDEKSANEWLKKEEW